MSNEPKQFGRTMIQYRNGIKVTLTVLDNLEEYEAHTEELDEYSFAYLCNNPQFSTVYTTTARDLEMYSDKLMNDYRVCPSVASVISRLRYGFSKRGIDPTQLPVIPIMEYKLVPTGNVYYFDPSLPPEEEKRLRKQWKDRQRYHANKRNKNKKD